MKPNFFDPCLPDRCISNRSVSVCSDGCRCCYPSRISAILPDPILESHGMRRRDVLALLCGLAVSTQSALAQKTGVPRIGFLSSRSADESGPLLTGFRQGLSHNGFVEGQTVEIEYRWAENKYERLPSLADDLVGRQVAIIVAAGGPEPRLSLQRRRRPPYPSSSRRSAIR